MKGFAENMIFLVLPINMKTYKYFIQQEIICLTVKDDAPRWLEIGKLLQLTVIIFIIHKNAKDMHSIINDDTAVDKTLKNKLYVVYRKMRALDYIKIKFNITYLNKI